MDTVMTFCGVCWWHRNGLTNCTAVVSVEPEQQISAASSMGAGSCRALVAFPHRGEMKPLEQEERSLCGSLKLPLADVYLSTMGYVRQPLRTITPFSAVP